MQRGIPVVGLLIVLCATNADAQGTSGDASRVFIAVSGGSQTSSRTFGDRRSEPYLGETASWTADYEVKRAPALDVTAGVRLWQGLAANVSFAVFSDTQPATVVGEIPHPFFFNQPRPLAGESRRLTHRERAVHVGASWMLPVSRQFQIAITGGPSFFTVERDMVQDVTYTDAYPFDEATYREAIVRRVSSNPVGYHVATDVSWFFARHVGIGAAGRFARADARLTSPADQETVKVRVGGLQAGAGLRLRFGR